MHIRRNPTEDEVFEVINSLREEEEKEITNLLESPAGIAMSSVSNSKHCYVIMDETHPVAICGIIDEENADIVSGIIWIMTSVKVYEQPIAFYKECKKLVNAYSTQYDRLFNYVAVEAESHQWFNDSLGFGLCPEVYEHKDTGQQYYMFEYISQRGIESMLAVEPAK